MTTTTTFSPRLLALGCVGAAAFALPAHAQDAETARKLGGVTVTDTAIEDSYKPDTVTNPLVTQPLRDTPRTVTVLDKTFLDDVQAVSFTEALRNVPGITLGVGEGGAGSGDFINLRGFDASNDIAIDGFADRLQYSRSDVFNLEQIEVYKGANTAFSGAGGAAGLINLVSKRAVAETFVRADAGVGNRDWLRGTVDANVLLDEGKGIAARLNLMAHDQGVAGRDFVGRSRFGIAPSLAFGLGQDTTLTASLQYQEDDNLIDYGVPVLANGTPANFPLSNYYGWRNIDFEDQELLIATVTLDHKISDIVSLTGGVRWGEVRREAVWSTPRPTSQASLQAAVDAIDAGNPAGANYVIGGPQGFGRISRNEVAAARAAVVIDHPTRPGGIGNSLAIGAEVSRESLDRDTISTTGLAGTSRNLFAPAPDFAGPITQTRTFGQFANEADRIAAYAFDTLKIGEALQVSLGGRFERFDVTLGGTNYAALATREFSEDLFSWQAGVVWKPAETASLYVSYSDARQPQTLGATATGTVTTANAALPALKNENYEIGAKVDLFDEQLALTAAVFRNQRVNQPITVDGDIALAGRQRVQGVELSATGNITDAWQVFAAYTFLDSEIQRASTADALIVGEELAGAPRHSGTVWSTYDTGLGLRLGGGFNYVGEFNTRNSTLANQAWQGGDYLLLNAMVEYRFTDNLVLQVNANNLANERFLERIRANDGYVIAVPGEGRTVMGTLRVSF
ncbi:TonB-dependent siderophore receptor [Porphyrobacter sp. TH134]|uniref:TonB-dependent receptor n=1 Tax=Porphyrobacter sp. TH134 TaxID=2067450 RepID=UPI000C7E6759|nr:TonB-dependent receptor [Porphyrobacter sp. TH134]PLK23897.1 TonB-dependent siderophore receptor [Porphyrobacter sp. TH134]